MQIQMTHMKQQMTSHETDPFQNASARTMIYTGAGLMDSDSCVGLQYQECCKRETVNAVRSVWADFKLEQHLSVKDPLNGLCISDQVPRF